MVKKRFISIVVTLGLVLTLALVPVASPVMADEDTATGSFTVGNAVPTVGTPSVTSPMTPYTQAWVNVTITDNNKLSDLSTVVAVLFYDADGSYTDPGASPSPNTQTLAIMTWYASNNTFTIQSGSPST